MAWQYLLRNDSYMRTDLFTSLKCLIDVFCAPFIKTYRMAMAGVDGPKLEVCIDSLESAVNAITGGADRLEVCSALEQDGLTPNPSLVHSIVQHCRAESIPCPPLYCMIRPRAGDFYYDWGEVDTCLGSIQALGDVASGFVFGAVNRDTDFIDKQACEQIMAAAKRWKKPVTFHRAFEACARVADYKVVMIELAALGFENILCCGGQPNGRAGNNLQSLEEIVQFGNQVDLCVIPGGGITPSDIKEVARCSRADWLHGSLSVLNEHGHKVTEESQVRQAKAILRSLSQA